MKRGILILGLVSVITGSLVFAQSMNIKGFHFVAPTVSDKANVYAPEVGEIVYDSTDSTFWGFDQGSTWNNMSGSGGVPAGTILPFGGTSAPSGYLIADGYAVSRTTYANLFAAIGTAFGSGNGSTTFNLPDLRGQFLRGVDGAAGRDPGASSRTAMHSGGNTGNNVGSVQDDQMQGHLHGPNTLLRDSTAHYNTDTGGTYNLGISPGNTAGPVSDGTNGTPRVGSETRPINAYVNYIVKI